MNNRSPIMVRKSAPGHMDHLIRRAADEHDDDALQKVMLAFKSHAEAIDGRFGKSDRSLEDLQSRLQELEQKSAARRGGGFGRDTVVKSWGQQLVDSEEFKGWVGANCKGNARITLKALGSDADSAGALIAPDRDTNVVTPPMRRLTVRALLAPGSTGSNSVEYVKQTGFTNNAAVVSEGAQKPESSITYEAASAPVRTIAHWIPASRQVMDDAPALHSLVDSDLRYGLGMAEEAQLLLGDGTGVNIHGLIPQATAFDPAFSLSGETMFDTLALAILQSEEAELPATGIMINTRDWRRMSLTKDAEGRYIGGGPFNPNPPTLWGLPVVYTNAMPEDDFLVGAFGLAAQVYDRMQPEVAVSDSDRDNFIKNMLTIRAEERVALAVKRTEALVYGSFGNSSS